MKTKDGSRLTAKEVRVVRAIPSQTSASPSPRHPATTSKHIAAMLATVLTSTLGGAKPEAVFLKARQALVADSSPLGGLTAAITALKSAQEACSVDKEADAPLRRVLNQTLSGYERRHELATFVPQPKPKLLKAQKAAQRKLKSMREDMEGDELQSNPAPTHQL